MPLPHKRYTHLKSDLIPYLRDLRASVVNYSDHPGTPSGSAMGDSTGLASGVFFDSDFRHFRTAGHQF